MNPLPTIRNKKGGFTFIEVMVAMLIFTFGVVTAIEIVQGAVRATRDAKRITEATFLLQNIMTELETKLETDGFTEGCEKQAEAKFAAPHEEYSWISYCTEIDFELSKTLAELQQTVEGEEDLESGVDKIESTVLDMASKYLSSAARELHAEIRWVDGGQERSVSATTHVVRHDLPFGFGLSTGSGGGSGGSGDSGDGGDT